MQKPEAIVDESPQNGSILSWLPQPLFPLTAVFKVLSCSSEPSQAQQVTAVDSTKSKGLKMISERLLIALEVRREINCADIPGLMVSKFKAVGKSEQKNIRRRIYDAINVLIATGRLERDGEVIRLGCLLNQNGKPMPLKTPFGAKRAIKAQHSEQNNAIKEAKLRIEKKANQLKRLQEKLKWLQRRAKSKVFRDKRIASLQSLCFVGGPDLANAAFVFRPSFQIPLNTKKLCMTDMLDYLIEP